MHPQITRQLAAAHRHDLLRAAAREARVNEALGPRPSRAEASSERLIYVTYALTGASRISFMPKPQSVPAVACDRGA
jgi:hypothetical protein